MTKLMQWKRTSDGSNASGLTLYLSLNGLEWHPYTHASFSHLKQPELNVKGASNGYSTAAYCLKLGFSYIPTDN